MKILHIISSVDRNHGGPVEGLVQSVRYRSSIGHNIEVLTLDRQCASCLVEFPGIAHGIALSNRKSFKDAHCLANWINQNAHRFDAAVIHGLWNYASIGGWIGCKKANLPYVVFVHGMMDPWFRRAYPIKHWVKQLFWVVQGRVLKDASEVLFTSEEEERLAKGVFWGYVYRSKVVAYAAAEAKIPSLEDNLLFKSLVPELHDNPYLLFLSRIHEKKGCDLLIEGFARSVVRPELRLVMAGPSHGDLSDRLRVRSIELGIADRVLWPGMVKDAAKAGAFGGAEAFVLTSHQENFGIAVAEALSYGKPVLISNQVNIWREIESGGRGLVAQDDIAGVTRLIAEWEAMTPDARAAMGSAARSIYTNNFTVKAAADDLICALQKAIDNFIIK